jgi:hypothetical protein
MKYVKVCPRGFANEYTIYVITNEEWGEYIEECGNLENEEGSGYTVEYKNPAQWVINRAIPWKDRSI